ncbi:hypothetical protein HYC85_022558 [Camellia sinensis]|uniref:Uncharacterized protein n=1 Tax=Camellia sinensis TaxID=4442 RepID=A0A7J7GNB5_CAMSI|nr:hypothetical protein HYC85_022558 [Camellia sinensis]
MLADIVEQNRGIFTGTQIIIYNVSLFEQFDISSRIDERIHKKGIRRDVTTVDVRATLLESNEVSQEGLCAVVNR